MTQQLNPTYTCYICGRVNVPADEIATWEFPGYGIKPLCPRCHAKTWGVHERDRDAQ